MIVSSKLTWACVLGMVGMSCLGSAKAASEIGVQDSNPYSVISDRNIFHLNPPPPPPAAEEPKPVDLPKVALTGFVGKGALMKVLLAIPPGKDSKESITYLTLAPGDRDHDVQLVRIHLEKEEVEIINSGTAQTLSRSNTLASLSSGPRPAGGAPGALGERGIHRATIPGFTPPGPVAPTAATAQRGGSSVVAGGRDSGYSGGAIVSGGGGGSSGALISGGGGYSGQALVGGGTTAAQYANAAPANNVGSQVANALFNPTSGHYQPSAPTAPPLPREVQAAVMAVQGGPPAIPEVQAAVEGLENQGGPPPVPGNGNE